MFMLHLYDPACIIRDLEGFCDKESERPSSEPPSSLSGAHYERTIAGRRAKELQMPDIHGFRMTVLRWVLVGLVLIGMIRNTPSVLAQAKPKFNLNEARKSVVF